MNIIIIISIFFVSLLFILKIILPIIGVNKISNQVNKTSETLKRLINNDFGVGIEDYSNWLNQSPDELWIRSLTYTTGKNKLRGELGNKLWMACKAIEKIISMDRVVSTAIKSGSIDFSTLNEMKSERDKIKAIIDQALSDVNKTLNQ